MVGLSEDRVPLDTLQEPFETGAALFNEIGAEAVSLDILCRHAHEKPAYRKLHTEAMSFRQRRNKTCWVPHIEGIRGAMQNLEIVVARWTS